MPNFEGYRTLITATLTVLAGIAAQFGYVISPEVLTEFGGLIISGLGIIFGIWRVVTTTPIGKPLDPTKPTLRSPMLVVVLAVVVLFLSGCGVLKPYEVKDRNDLVALSYSEIEGLAVATTEACCVGETPGALITRSQAGEVKTILKRAYASTATAKYHLISTGEPDQSRLADAANLARQAASLLEQWGVNHE